MAWQVLESLRVHASGKLGIRDLAALRGALALSHGAWRPLQNVRAGDDGVFLDRGALSPASAAVPAFTREPGLQLFRVERTLGSEVLSRRSEPMRAMAGPPLALMSPADVARLGLQGRVMLEVDGSAVEVAARAQAGVPDGVVLVSRDVEWPIIPRQGAPVRATAVHAEEAVR
jgi:hypothetical protein